MVPRQPDVQQPEAVAEGRAMKPKKPRKPEVVEVRFRLLTDRTNATIKDYADRSAENIAYDIQATIVRKPTVERVGKR